jgi:hypothetical protein
MAVTIEGDVNADLAQSGGGTAHLAGQGGWAFRPIALLRRLLADERRELGEKLQRRPSPLVAVRHEAPHSGAHGACLKQELSKDATSPRRRIVANVTASAASRNPAS